MFPLLLFRPVRRRLPIRRPALPACSTGGSIGGAGDDVIIIGSGVPGPPGPPGPQGIQGEIGPQGEQGIPGELSPVPVTLVTETPYQITTDDYFLAVDFGGIAGDVILPIAPTSGDVYIVKDISGNGSLAPITITSNGPLIDGTGTAVINTDFGSLTFIYSGLDWSIV